LYAFGQGTIHGALHGACYGFTLLSKFFINGASVGLYIQTNTNVEANIDRIRRGWNNRKRA